MANWRDEVLLEGDFSIPPKIRILFKVTLTPLGIFYSQISTISSQYEEKFVQISDVIGCHCGSANVSPTPRRSDNTASFTVYSYPFRKKLFSGKKTRHRVAVTFETDQFATFEENHIHVLRWKNVINCLSRGIHINPGDVDSCESSPMDRFLILVNPHSGPGRAMQICKGEVEPMLEEACIPFKIIVTEYAGHAHDLIQNLELAEWGAVVIVSGDGLVYEVFNGLMKRADWTTAIKKPVGYIPGGSGNALGCAINYAAGEPVLENPVLHSTFVLIKHRVVPMDLVLVQTPSQQLYSFLSVTWGIVADIDYESEKYRNLGEARFTVGAIKRIVNLRSYSGRLSFLPVAEYVPKSETAPRRLTKVRRFSLRSMSNSLGSIDSIDSRQSRSSSVVLTSARSLESSPLSSDRVHGVSAPGYTNGGGDVQLTINEQSGSDSDTLSSPSKPAQKHSNSVVGGGDGAHWTPAVPRDTATSSPPAAVVDVTSTTEINSNFTQNARTRHSPQSSMHGPLVNGTTPQGGQQQHKTTGQSDFEEETFYADKKDGHAVPTPFLPPLDEPVPDNWVVIEGKFVLACAIYQTHLGSDMLAAPSARLSDGIIHLMFVREGISRNNLFNLFLTFSEGTHIDSPYVEFVPVLAFRLEPHHNSGNIMIDGERLDEVMPVQGQVLPGLARIMAIQ
ncbi:sphingosine kinase 2-like [Littorina saxatilis]|uniref:sphingosine kinase n=1 Tax=Littorina saxatilis TaxID=31220 RepID=A0AAN9BUX2_9CAEN